MKHLFFLFALFLLSSNGKGQIITTFAGNGTKGFSGDGGFCAAAQLNGPSDVFKDWEGNFYIADRGNNRIRKVDMFGTISTFAGNGNVGYSGDGGQATNAALNLPTRVVADESGNVYIADRANNVIRRVNSQNIISTVARTGFAGFSGDGGPASSAQLNGPTGVAIDLSGNIFISDSGNSRIRKISPAGTISTYAGGGAAGYATDGVPATSVSLCEQIYVSVDKAGTIYITNRGCWHFLKVTPDGLIYNVSGKDSPSYSGDCGRADSANIEGPSGICPDNLGNIYLCPRSNFRVRRVNTLNFISTVAGTGVAGFSGDGGEAIDAMVSSLLYGICADTMGHVYFADMGNNVIRTFIEPRNTYTIPCPGATLALFEHSGAGIWTTGNAEVATVDSTGVVTGVSPGLATITFTGAGCPELYFVTVDISCNEIRIHDVITPNGDGINDYWEIEGIQEFPKNSVRIFDKWGDRLYEKAGYHNEWDGKSNQGMPLPAGTYFYVIKLNADNPPEGKNLFRGSILIRR